MIQKHNFEVAKTNIERFSRNLPSNPSFTPVEVNGGIFGLGDHNVTGTEMNDFIDKVQDKLISVNSSLRAIICEFKEVYNAFDYLDGEYISGIIGSVESAEKASEQALKAQSDIAKTVNNLKRAVDELIELNETVKRMNSEIAALQQFCHILDSYEHLSDIDTIWKDIAEQETNIVAFHQQIERLNQRVHTTENEIKATINNIADANSPLLLTYNKKVRIAYCIGGSALGLSILHFILHVFAVL